MKGSYFLVVFCLVATGFVFAQEVQSYELSDLPMFKRDKVEQHARSIERMMYRHSCVRVAIATGVVLKTVCTWKQWLWDDKPAACPKVKDPVVTQEFQASSDDQDCFFVKWSNNLTRGCKYLCSADGLWKLGMYGLYVPSFYVMKGKICNYAFHPYTLKWYIVTHAPYREYANTCIGYCDVLQELFDNVKEQEYCIRSIQSSGTELVACCERICGYILYQKQDEPVEKHEQYERIIVHINDSVASWKLKLQSTNSPQEWKKATEDLVNHMMRDVQQVKLFGKVI